MSIRLYNTLSKRIEPFAPLDPPRITFYTCGPTVYDYAHIGNFRSFLAADLLRRYLEYRGYTVRHVMNLTDVGHMVDDALADGGGPDKLEIARRRLLEAKKAGTLPQGVDLDPNDPGAIADFYASAFLEDARILGLKVVFDADEQPELLPRPTRYIAQMIALIERLIEGGHAYIASDGVVYFDVQSFPDYGRLSGNTLDQVRAGAGGRVDEANQAVKKHPADFMLWKPDPHHLMRWPSPWGEGYPGWHLECSAMAMELLAEGSSHIAPGLPGEYADAARPSPSPGKPGAMWGMIDLHSGGEDNIFPHHECEIAQSRAATGAPHFARYWFHARHLFVEGAKMSKSKGTFHTPRELVERGFSPAAIRLELIKTHYRSNANFTFQGLKDSERMVERWRTFVEKGESAKARASASRAVPGPGPVADDSASTARDAAQSAFRDALDDDLNIAGAIGAINRWIGAVDSPDPLDARVMRQFDSVLGVLELRSARAVGVAAPPGLDAQRIEQLLADRTAARQARDFARADAIRAELLEMGVEIHDSPQGTRWTPRPRV